MFPGVLTALAGFFLLLSPAATGIPANPAKPAAAAQVVPVTPLEPFEARYVIYEDGDEMGESLVQLQKSQDHWQISSQVRGTHGMASLLGFKRKESTIFDWQPQATIPWRPRSYRFSQKVAFKKKTSQYETNPTNGQVSGKTGSKKWQLRPETPFITPNLVVLALADDLCRGKQDMRYQVLDKGKIKDYHFTVVGNENGLIKVAKEHGSPERITESWHDPQRQCLNVRSRHKEPGGDWLETVLVNSQTKTDSSHSAYQ